MSAFTLALMQDQGLASLKAEAPLSQVFSELSPDFLLANCVSHSKTGLKTTLPISKARWPACPENSRERWTFFETGQTSP